MPDEESSDHSCKDDAKSTVSFKVGGVPEHFNAPWHIAKNRGLYEKAGIECNWTDYPGGTGAMTQALDSGELDVAVLLTEGAVSYISKGSSSRIVGLYVRTPLTWGVHVASARKDEFATTASFQKAVFGISRLGSGSHLMAFLFALQCGWDPKSLKFEQVGSLQGAREAMKEKRIDAFMWEKFTTKWLCDQDEWYVAEKCVTPWPCFVICATQKCIEEKAYDLRQLLAITRLVCHDLETHRGDWGPFFAEEYKMTKEDTQEWQDSVSWSCEPSVSVDMLTQCMTTLQKLCLLPTSAPPVSNIIAKLPGGLREDHLHNMYWYRRRQVIQVVEAMLARKAATEGLTIDEEERVTHYHYWGNKAVDDVYKEMGLNDPSKTYEVLDAGSGLGGSARYWVRIKNPKTHITAIEIQPELTALAQRLTARSQVKDKIRHLCDDIATTTTQRLGYKVDGIFSLNVILHIPDRPALLKNLRKLLVCGGVFFAHDYYLKKEACTPREATLLGEVVACRDLPTEAEYKTQLREAGFELKSWKDTSQACKEFVTQRLDAFQEKKKIYEEHHGKQVAEAFSKFYEAVAELFTTPIVGGVNYLVVASGRDRR